MFQDDYSDKIFSRRAFFIGGLQLIGIMVLGGRLAWLQIAQKNRYKTLSDKNRISIKILAPSRGQILDRFGVPLAINTQNYQALIIPEQANDIEKSLVELSKIIELDQPQIDEILKKAKTSAKFIPIKVKESLTWQDVAKIEVNLPDLPGISINRGQIRTYPYRDSTAHIIGYVRSPSEDDLKQEDPVLRLPDFKIGKTGIERVFDTILRGEAGASEVEVNVFGREVRELKRKPPKLGERITLTIDGELQRFAQEALSAHKSASAVIMDANTGMVYALASNPSFDPNMFVRGLTNDEWAMIRDNPLRPQNNKAISGLYPPGSTFKMITILAGLKAGVINEHTKVKCPGHYEYGNHKFHCWKKWGHGTVNLISALEQSCDVYFYKMATEVGIDKIAEMAREFGLGHSLDLGLLEEKEGLMPDKAWKRRALGTRWEHGETIVASIGQGYIQATPLQLAVMTARLVNGGYDVKPSIIEQIGQTNFQTMDWKSLGIPQKHLDLVIKGMTQVVNGEKGTARGSKITEVGMEMGGKTGTSQVRTITKEQRRLGVKNEDLPYNQRHHALFVGFAPLDKPKYVCSVVVEHGVSGSGAAAPLAKILLEETQRRDPARAKETL